MKRYLLLLALAACEPTAIEAVDDSPAAEPVAHTVEVGAELLDSGRIALGAVESRSVDDLVRATGRAAPDIDGEATIAALVPAVVRSVRAREGQAVSRGDLLAELDLPDGARVAGELARARAAHAHAEKTLAREKLLITSGSTSRRELEAAEADVAAAVADERAAGLLLATWGTRGGRLQVRAPITGQLVHRGATLGAHVDAGFALFRIVDLSKLIISAQVLERDAHRVTSGAPVRIRQSNGASCRAVVEASAGEVEAERHTVPVRLRPEGCEGLLAGQLVHAEIGGDGAGVALTVARDALSEIDGRHFVFVAKEQPGAFVAVPVTVARFTELTAVLHQGPPAGTRVAVRGVILLKGELMRSSLE